MKNIVAKPKHKIATWANPVNKIKQPTLMSNAAEVNRKVNRVFMARRIWSLTKG
jgi:hypothetical protein